MLADPGLVPAWIEETLRHDTSSQMLARYVVRDAEVAGTTIPAGSKALVLLGSANRDERVFTDPTTYDIGRDKAELAQILRLRHRPALLPRRQPRAARGAGGAGGDSSAGSRPSRCTPSARCGCTPPACAASRPCRSRSPSGARDGWITEARPPRPPPGRRRGRLVRDRRRDRARPRGSRLPPSPSVRAGWTACRRLATEIREAGERRSCTPSTSPRPPRWRSSRRPRPPVSARPRWWCATPGCSRRAHCSTRAPTSLAAEFDVNVLGAHRLVRAFGTGMVERQRGDLVFVSSDTALRARPFMRGYSATKSGLEGLVEALQMEPGGHGGARVRRTPRADVVGDGLGLGRRRRREGPHRVDQVGARPALALPQGIGGRGRDRHGRQRPARGAPQSARREPRSTPGGQVSLHDIPEVSTLLDDQDVSVPAIIKGTGHLPEMRVDPIALFHRVREECGDIGRFRLADKQVVLVTGAEANEAFFRAPDDVLDQAAAYPFMTPIFGKGVVFDASPEERQQMLKNQALRGDMMRGHAQTIEAEIRRMVAGWGEEGEIDLLDFFAESTIYTTSSCLIGKPFRDQARRLLRGGLPPPRARHRRHRLRRPVRRHRETSGSATRRGRSLVAKVQAIIAARRARGEVPKEERDLLDVLIAVGYDADMVTGIFISMMFAGHHTSSGTASWAMIESAAQPGRDGRRRRRVWTRCTPTAARSPSRPCARSPCWRRHSRRPCASTRRW
ncbi:cytochrome P450 [Nocardioides convexus]|uniref:cytochrome P450 n=1 Tax=Nocardioides convexus TaxID=2712224 RepID=UPI002418ACD1|nr:cytochrome P450 [Nocardioides convexus]